MKNNKFYRFVQQLKNDMEPMSARQRMEHILYHFKWHLLAIVACIIVAISLIFSIVDGSKPFMLGGGTVNASLSEEGTIYLTDNYLSAMGSSSKKHQISFFDSGLTGLDAAQIDQNPNFTMTFMTMVGAEKFDYIIMDEVAMTYYMEQGLFMDLHDVFTQEELLSLDTLIAYANIYDENGVNTGETYPVGICIDALSFTTECVQPSENVYLLFAKNAPHKDQLHSLYDYLCSWTPDS